MKRARILPDGPFHPDNQPNVAADVGDLLYEAAMGGLELSQTQMRAAEVLLKKVQPDLTQSNVKVTLADMLMELGRSGQPALAGTEFEEKPDGDSGESPAG